MVRFSRRTNWDASENPLTRLLEEVKRSGRPWINLTQSNPTRCGFAYPPDFLSVFNDPRNLSYDPDSKGMSGARQAVSDYYRRRGYAVDPGRIILTSSTSEAYSWLFRLLADAGDTVLFPRPSYPLFQFLADLNDARLAFYDLVYDGRWVTDFSSMADQADQQTKAVVVVNPNNPTGSFVSRDDVESISGFCRERSLALISDEVFYDYVFDPSRQTSFVDNRRCLTLTMNGLSKIMGMPQMKLSWIVVSGPDDLVEEALKRLEMIADTYLSVNTPVQTAWPEWLGRMPEIQTKIRDRVMDNHQWLRTRLASTALGCLAVEGGWYAVVDLPEVQDEDAWAMMFLREAGVYVHPGYFFDMDGCRAVISLLPEPEAFRDGIERILNVVKIELSKR